MLQCNGPHRSAGNRLPENVRAVRVLVGGDCDAGVLTTRAKRVIASAILDGIREHARGYGSGKVGSAIHQHAGAWMEAGTFVSGLEMAYIWSSKPESRSLAW